MLNRIREMFKNNNKGFTLVEVVVASVIVVIVSVMLVYAFVGAAGVSKRANEIKDTVRDLDSDIHMDVEVNSNKAVENLTFGATVDGVELEVGDQPFRIPMNVYTFTDENTDNRQMMVFRNPE